MTFRLAALLLPIAASVPALAADVNLSVIVEGQVAPGVYGRVDIGNAPPPPLVYAQPVLIERRPAPPPPIYVHVPPGHAKNWAKHCKHYNACGVPVYFVKSEEYEPKHKGKKGK